MRQLAVFTAYSTRGCYNDTKTFDMSVCS